MKSIILRLGDAETFTTLPAPIQEQIMAFHAQWVRAGRSSNGYYIVDAITTDAFDPSVLGAFGLTWEVLGMWQWDGGAVEEVTDAPPVEYAADQITDVEVDIPRYFPRHFVRKTVGGVQCLNDYGDVIMEISGVVPASDGGYTVVSKEAAKLVAGVGLVRSDSIRDGKYTRQEEIRTSRVVTLVPVQAAKYIDHMPSLAGGGRPTVAKETVRWAGWPERF